MLIKLKDNDGRVIEEVEVDEAFGEWYVEQDRLEENEERKKRYWVTVSLDSLSYEGMWFADPNPTPAELCELDEERRMVKEFMSTLTETQKRRLQIRMDNPGISDREIARREGVDNKQIQKSFDGIRKKYEKFKNRDLKKHVFSPYSEGGNGDE